MAKTRVASGLVFFALLSILAFYIYVYQTYPFNDSWNDISLNSAMCLSAALAAIAATLVFITYYPDDRPKAIWRDLVIGSWSWAIAEIIWSVMAYYMNEVPSPSYADIFWVVGFLFFTSALYRQYGLIDAEKFHAARQVAMYVWIGSLVIPYLFLLAFSHFSVEAYVDYWYALMDFAAGVAGLLIVLSFQGGALARPWIGLLIFGVSDLLFAWANQSGLYTWSSEQGNSLTLIIDSSYTAAYLVLAFGFFSQWMLLKYGTNQQE